MTDGLQQRRQEMEAEALRVNAGRKPKFGDLMRNPWAGEGNPTRDGYFVRAKLTTGRMNPGLWYEMTDRNGKFWETNGKCAMFVEARASIPPSTGDGGKHSPDGLVIPPAAGPAGQRDAHPMGWHEDLQAIDRAMQHMGDVLNEMDAVEEVDEEAATPGFEAIARLLKCAADWALVPIKPTPKMIDATFDDHIENESHNKHNKRIYAAMIAAAPALSEATNPVPCVGGNTNQEQCFQAAPAMKEKANG